MKANNFKWLALMFVMAVSTMGALAQTSQELTQNVCPGPQPYYVTPGSTLNTFLWSISGIEVTDYTISDKTNPSTNIIWVNSAISHTYTITFKEIDRVTLCYDEVNVEVTVNTLPTASIAYSGTPYCAIGTATVTQTGQAGGTYSSTTGLVIVPATGAIDLVASTAGIYTVTYTVGNGTCTNTTTTSLTINDLPTATIVYSGTSFCAIGTASVAQTGQAGGTYSSTTGLVIVPATGVIDLAASTTGIYTVTYSFGNGTCTNTTTTSVAINDLPTATIAYSGTPYCAIGTAAVTQTGQAGGTYSSTTGLVIVPATGVIDLVASTAGIYTITYTVGNGTCTNTATTNVTATILPNTSLIYHN